MLSGFYETGANGLWIFLLVTLLMGGGAAYVSGSAIATTWRPPWQLPGAAFLLACAVRFFHYALFAEPLLSLQNFLVDYAVVLLAAGIGYQRTRTLQMVAQYPWAYEAAGPLRWRAKRC
jgi:Domain of unknown function (DUF6867)